MTLLSPTKREIPAEPAAAIEPHPVPLPQRMPRQLAPNVAELSSRLYCAYSVEGGTVRLAGCTIEPVPVISAVGKCADESVHVYLSATGELLDEQTITELGLHDEVAIDKATRILPAESDRLANLGRSAIENECQKSGRRFDTNTVEVAIVWCRWAAGKLRFTIGEQFVELPFADWAARLKSPAWVCPHSGQATYQLAATDDGRIAAAQQIATCQQSNRRLLRSELAECHATGQLVARDLTEQCPVTEQPVLLDKMTHCPRCRLRISPRALSGEGCVACKQTAAVRKSDPRMCLVLGEHMGLDRWLRWRIAETPQSYVLEAIGLVRRLLVVVDKQSLQPVRLATRNFLQSAWSDIPRQEWREFLQ